MATKTLLIITLLVSIPPQCHSEEVNLLFWSTLWGAVAVPSDMMEFFGVPKDGVIPCDPEIFNGTCKMTSDRDTIDDADVLLWHLRDFRLDDLPDEKYRKKTRAQNKPLWVHYTLEAYLTDSQDHMNRESQDFADLFDGRMYPGGGESDSATYIKTGFQPWFPPVTNAPAVPPTKRDAWGSTLWAQNNMYSKSGREYWGEGLIEHMPNNLHSIGKCMPNGPPEPPAVDRTKYKFQLAWENSLCTEYTSEKVCLSHTHLPFISTLVSTLYSTLISTLYSTLISTLYSTLYSTLISKLWRAFSQGSVPVVIAGTEKGGADVWRAWAPAEKSMIMAQSFATPKKLAEYLEYLDQNMTAYIEYLSYRNGLDDILKEYGLKKQSLRPEFIESMRGLNTQSDQWCSVCEFGRKVRHGLKLQPLQAENSCMEPWPTPGSDAENPTPTATPTATPIQYSTVFGGEASVIKHKSTVATSPGIGTMAMSSLMVIGVMMAVLLMWKYRRRHIVNENT